MKNVTISVKELANLLKKETRSNVLNVTYLVDETLSKQVKKVHQIQKLVNISHVYINHDYQNKVRNLTGLEFEAKNLLDYGRRRICTTLLQAIKTEEFILDGIVLNNESIQSITYFHKGTEITKKQAEELDLFAPRYYNPTEEKTKGRGTVSKEDNFGMCQPYLKRIKLLKMNKITYEIID
jgi:hypothetical protein